MKTVKTQKYENGQNAKMLKRSKHKNVTIQKIKRKNVKMVKTHKCEKGQNSKM